jgi:hypothetical protein
MFARSVAFLAALAAVAQAQIDPGVGETFKAGSECSVEWKVDPTGLWKTMHIQLMSGSNFDMKHVTTAGTVDGTDPTKTTFTWTCPELDPYSEIYFYQFSTPASKELIWTTRFLITDKDGKSVPPANPTQPDGKPIGWGIGKLVDSSSAVPPPTDIGTQASSSSGSSSDSTSSSASVSASISTTASVSRSVGVSASSGTASVPPSSTSGMVKTSSAATTKPSGVASAGTGNTTTANTAGENGAEAPAVRGAALLALLGVAVVTLL